MLMKWVVFSCLVVGAVHAFPSGPPFSTDPNLCVTMFPSGHNAAAQTTPSPFVITVDTPTCYTSGLEVIVSVRATPGVNNELDGMLMEARLPSNTTQAFGTWSPMSWNSGSFRADNCFGKTANAISHKKELDDSKCESLKWRAPANFTSTIEFVGTFVQETKVFWINVKSAPIHYSANCTATGTQCPKPTPEPNSVGRPEVHMAAMFATLFLFLMSLI